MSMPDSIGVDGANWIVDALKKVNPVLTSWQRFLSIVMQMVLIYLLNNLLLTNHF